MSLGLTPEHMLLEVEVVHEKNGRGKCQNGMAPPSGNNASLSMSHSSREHLTTLKASLPTLTHINCPH